MHTGCMNTYTVQWSQVKASCYESRPCVEQCKAVEPKSRGPFHFLGVPVSTIVHMGSSYLFIFRDVHRQAIKGGGSLPCATQSSDIIYLTQQTSIKPYKFHHRDGQRLTLVLGKMSSFIELQLSPYFRRSRPCL